MDNIMQVFSQMMQVIQMGNNPQQFLTNMMRQNPQLNAMFQMGQKSGNMEQFVRQYAKQNNIDIQPMIDMFSGNGTQAK